MALVQIVLVAAVLVAIGWIAYQVAAHASGQQRALIEEEVRQELAESRTAEAMAREGATPERAFVVRSAAAIEPRAQSEPCPICRGHLHVDAHEVETRAGARLRRLEMRCGTCGRRSDLFFRVSASAPN